MVSLVYIPVIAVFTLFLFAPSTGSEGMKTSPTEQKATVIQNGSQNAESDYRAILSFIKNKYRQIKEEDAQNISKYLVEYGEKNKVDPKFAAAVIARESSFNKEAVSKTGAKGLGQIKDFNFDMLSIKDPFSIQENVSGLTQYLRKMLDKWQSQIDNGPQSINHPVQPASQLEKVRLSLASYYKGFTAVNKDGGTFDEKTKGYVDDILVYYDEIMNQKL